MGILQVGVFLGSLRRDSFSRKIAGLVTSMLPKDFQVKTVELSNLVMYNQDYDDQGNTPPEWTLFRQEVKNLDGLLFVTPEYNRSLTPVLKNALDIASRPLGQSVWNGKPGAIISVSPGKIGGFGANQHLRQSMAFLNIMLMSQPEAYISQVNSLFNDQGECINESTKDFLCHYAEEFARWLGRFTKP